MLICGLPCFNALSLKGKLFFTLFPVQTGCLYKADRAGVLTTKYGISDMLQKLNERIQGVVAWIVVVLIALTFTLFGVDYYMQNHQASAAVVEVNGKEISKQDFETNYRRDRQQRDPSQLTAASDLLLKQQVLNAMIKNEVGVQAAYKAGFVISPEQANDAILSIPQFQEDGHFSPERYQQTLNNALFTAKTFHAEVMQGMLLNQQRFAFMGTAFSLPDEIRHYVTLSMQTRDYEYIKIPVKPFIQKDKVSEQAINDYYKKNPAEFMEPEKISLDYIRLSMNAIKGQVKINDEQVKRYYDDNQSSYLTPSKWQVSHILLAVPADASEDERAQIQKKADELASKLQAKPELFNESVKTLSDDKLSIANKGLLPWITAGQSGFDKELVTLTSTGQISNPIKTETGYEIFRLESLQPARLKKQADVDAEIRTQLVAEVAQANYAQALEKLGDLSYQSPDSLSPVADALNLPIEKTELFSNEGGNTDLLKNHQVVNMAFSSDVLELGNNSEPVQLDNDTVIVFRVDQHVAATEKPLSAVKEQIATKLSLQEARQKVLLLGAKIKEAQTNPPAFQNLLAENKLSWKPVEKLGREAEKIDPAINDLAFTIAKPEAIDGLQLMDGDYAIVRLKKINEGQYKTLDSEEQVNIAQQIEANYGVMDYDFYINELVAQAKIRK